MDQLPEVVSTLEDPIPTSPLPLVARWLEEARSDGECRNPDAMALSSVDSSGRPRVRMVLCRSVDVVRGRFGFYTNRESPKARELEASGWASGVFYWAPQGRQLRISGRVERMSDDESDAYFVGRPRGAQLAAWASAQSEHVNSRAALLGRLEEATRRWGGSADSGTIPRPPHWGGYAILADRIELWVDRRDRLHDRVAWSRSLDDGGARLGGSAEGTPWVVERLQP